MASENNTDNHETIPVNIGSSTATPVANGINNVTSPMSTNPTVPVSPDPNASTQNTKPVKSKPAKGKGRLLTVVLIILIILLAAAVPAAYFYGKSHAKEVVSYQSAPPKTISLPSDAVVTSSCVPGRGKQYIEQKDIPVGPVYDVENQKVIAVEYNFKATDLFNTGTSNKLSDTIIQFFQNNYSAKYLSITPGQLKAGESSADTPINVAIFVVPRSVSNNITC